jgi:L-cysteine desulfidase
MHWQAQVLAAAAVDARMGGLTVRIMTSSGSGNQGITVTLPSLGVARCLGADERLLVESVALGHLLLAQMAGEIGLLSALCGAAVQAAAASSAAMVCLMGGTPAQVEQATSAVLGSQASILCDGATADCAFRAAGAAAVAVKTACMVVEGWDVSSGDGLIGQTVLETARNVARIARHGMEGAAEVMLGVLEKPAA